MTAAERLRLSAIVATLEADVAAREAALITKVRVVSAIDYIAMLEAKIAELQAKQTAKDAVESTLPAVLAKYP